MDVFLGLVHFHLNNNEEKIYFTIDDILEFRKKKKTQNSINSRGGYQSNMRDAIVKSLDFLQVLGFVKIYQYKKYYFEAEMSPKILAAPTIKVNSKLLEFDPLLKGWHKNFAYFIEFNKKNNCGKSKEIQIKKILNTVEVSKYLKKYEI